MLSERRPPPGGRREFSQPSIFLWIVSFVATKEPLAHDQREYMNITFKIKNINQTFDFTKYLSFIESMSKKFHHPGFKVIIFVTTT
ncbi:MAG: hypothetical protein Q8910_15975, partial [Bacteroidota bacterium]|nr:hypothetical protein [Bacteroidota bacterium]